MGSNPGTNIASASTNFNWNNVIKKEAMEGDDMADLGEVQEVGQHYILTQRGVVHKDKFYIPKYLVIGFDRNTLWFDLSEAEIMKFNRESPPPYDEYENYRRMARYQDIESRLPFTADRRKLTRDSKNNTTTTSRSA